MLRRPDGNMVESFHDERAYERVREVWVRLTVRAPLISSYGLRRR